MILIIYLGKACNWGHRYWGSARHPMYMSRLMYWEFQVTDDDIETLYRVSYGVLHAKNS